MAAREAHRVVEAVWRIESARLIAGLARLVRDVGLAEDAAADALVAALEQWPETGVPDNPGAWLMTIGKRRAIDAVRRRVALDRKYAELGSQIEAELAAPRAEPVEPDEVDDDMLRLMFVSCHPVLSAEARVALTLRLLGGLTTEEIARAFLVPEPTIGQRISRAKRTLAEADVRFEVPAGSDRAERLASVLEVVYLVFNEGYSATTGDRWVRHELCEEALRLGRILAGLVPAEPEVHGLVALMEIQASRLRARSGPAGEPVRLLDQDRSRWDRLLIRRGLAALDRAERLTAAQIAATTAVRDGTPAPPRPGRAAGTGDGTPAPRAVAVPGAYTLQAAIAACHARALSAEETDWARIAALYGSLAVVAPSPIVELNRAVAVAMADGPAAGLVLVDALAADPAMAGYHLYPSVRGDLLERLGRTAEARAEFARAAALTRNVQERELLLGRAGAGADPR